MTRMSRSIALALSVSFSLALSACGPKDADVKAAVDTAIAGVQGITVSVADGVATIAGQFADAAAKTSVEAKIGAVKGVKSVVDNATVMPPPAPVVISPDDSLKTNVMAALKEFAHSAPM